MTTPGSIEIDAKLVDGESKPRRGYSSPHHLVVNPDDEVATVPDILKYAKTHYGDKLAYGHRKVLEVIDELETVRDNPFLGAETKLRKVYRLGDYRFETYREFYDTCHAIAAGLIAHNIQAGQVLNIYASTCLNWQHIQHACALVSIVITTAYDTLPSDGLAHTINQPECVGIFTHAELIPNLLKVLGDTPTLRLIVYDGDLDQTKAEEIRALREDVTVISIEDLVKEGEVKIHSTDFASRVPKPSDMSCIMYSSGSTTGVVLTHANLVASVGAIHQLLGNNFQPDDAVLAYLPLAHIIEYIVELTFFFAGIVLGFGRIKTLTSLNVRDCQGDIAAFKPTILVGLPEVWESLRKVIMDNVSNLSYIKQGIFGAALQLKKHIPLAGGLADRAVFTKVKERLGGRLRFALCGGATLSRETQEFLNLSLVTLLQGYGLTESCGICTILPPQFMQYGSVGVPVPSMEIKLITVSDLGFYPTHGERRWGEILIKGNSLAQGYFDPGAQDKIRRVVDLDGWFHTGDVGTWNSDGTLTVIDRIKNFKRLSSGKCVPLGRLESVYKASNLVSNICVHAEAFAKHPMAIIFPNENYLRKTLLEDKSTASLAKASLSRICETKRVASLFTKSLTEVANRANLDTSELLEAVILSPEEWTPENRLVTASHKINRELIVQKFKKQIEDQYHK